MAVIVDLVSNKLILMGTVFSFLFINQLEKNILKKVEDEKNCYSFLLLLNLKLKEAALGYDNFNPRASSFVTW